MDWPESFSTACEIKEIRGSFALQLIGGQLKVNSRKALLMRKNLHGEEGPRKEKHIQRWTRGKENDLTELREEEIVNVGGPTLRRGGWYRH